ncbi:hypothetical protein ACIO93_35915 [Streptomyces sp. NPDC087903]|uniref:hypothetical protein n=1 Tax=Streptomyces sp. NPDC087903 TaxID=3365819 RepID=UPI0038265BC7
MTATTPAQTPPTQATGATPLLAAAARMQAAQLPAACQEAIFKTGEKFPTTRYAIPDEPGNALIVAMANLTEAEQAELT